MLQLIAQGKSNKEIAALLDFSVNTVSVHRANLMEKMNIHRTAELVLFAIRKAWSLHSSCRRRWTDVIFCSDARGAPLFADTDSAGFRFADVTRESGIHFDHHSGAFGQKYLPETLGPGCAFLDYDNDGWQDILFIDGTDWQGHERGPGRQFAAPVSQ